MKRLFAIALTALCTLANAQVPDSALAPLIRTVAADEQTVRNFYDLRWSSARMQALDALAERYLDQIEAMSLEGMDVVARADAVMLRFHLEDLAASVALDRARRAEMLELLPYLELVERLEQDRALMSPLDLPALAREISAIPGQIERLRARIVKPTDEVRADSIVVSPTLALRTASASADTLEKLERWARHYRNFMPGFAWWLDTPIDKSRSAIREYENHLRREMAQQKGNDDDPLVGQPEGRERLMQSLRREMIAYTPEELIQIGQRELAWCQQELRAAAREMGCGDDFHAAIEEVKTRHAAPGEQARLVTEQAAFAIDLVDELVTVPELCAKLWRTQMIPTRDQRIWPFAAYNNNHVMVSFATDEMDTDAKLMSMRGNNEHFTRIVVPHELIPGHHLQGFMADRIRTYRKLFSTPFFVEGWALYWEFELWDRGYARGPEDRVGMLFWRSHRAARIIVSLKFHLGEMTPEEMIEFLIEQVGHERASATSEVRRYINGMYSPLYQVAYMIGGLQLRALKRELVDGGHMGLRAYNDALLEHNAIPVEMIRAQMLGLELGLDYEPMWRFDDPAANP